MGSCSKMPIRCLWNKIWQRIENRNQTSDEKLWRSKIKRLELAARTKFTNLYLCHKQSGKEQVQGKMDK